MRMRLVSLALALCASQSKATEPWPLPPDSYFLERIAPPPAPDSRADLADREASVSLQKKATPDEIARAESFVKSDVFDFADVVGPNFTPSNFPQTAAFFDRLRATADRPKNFIKDHYARPRPYLAHPDAIKQLITPDTGYSYPSGHGTRSWLYARVLGELDPSHSKQYLERADAIGQSRVLGGMHYLSDIAASHTLADSLFASLMAEPAFRSQLETLRSQEWNSPPHPDAIVLGIADGTSQELITAARIYSVGAKGKLALETLPHTAIVHTWSASDFVTDSAAAATAMARGIKADNMLIGQASKDSQTSPPSLLDLARKAGWSTAVITDDSVTGGTPAPFLVEDQTRADHAAIASKLIAQLGPRADIVIGGGSQWFSPQNVEYKDDQRNVVVKNSQRLADLPISHIQSWEEFAATKTLDRPILGTFFPDVFPFFADGSRQPRLLDMVKKTVELLKARGKPFLIVFEAALPDKACHLNNAKRAIVEVLEFDATLAWLQSHLGPNALILATTDHNNGGFTINGPPAPIRWQGEQLLGLHPVTSKSILTWASGPGANRESPNALLPPNAPAYTQPALLFAESAAHSGGDVWLIGSGPGSENVRGYLDNTDIYQIISRAISYSDRPPDNVPLKQQK